MVVVKKTILPNNRKQGTIDQNTVLTMICQLLFAFNLSPTSWSNMTYGFQSQTAKSITALKIC
jgi:hypothetical protein